MAGEVAGGDGAADVEGVGRAQGQLLVGVRGDRGLQVQGVGQVELAVDVRTVPATPASASAMSKCRASAAARRSASVASGSNRALASSTSRPSCAGPMVCANGATLASTNAAASGDRHRVRSAMNASRHAASSPASTRAQQRGSR